MDEEDFVETSDPEELELSFTAVKRFRSPNDCASPLKRTKLYHAPVSGLEPSALHCFALKNGSELQLVVADSQEDASMHEAQQRETDVDVASPKPLATVLNSPRTAKIEDLSPLPSPTRRDHHDHTNLSFSDVCLDSNFEDAPASFSPGTRTSSSDPQFPDVDAPEWQEPEHMEGDEACIARPLVSSQSPYSSVTPLVPYSGSASDSDLQGAPVSREPTPGTETSEFQSSLALPSTSPSPFPTSQTSENMAQALFSEDSVPDQHLEHLSSPGRLSSAPSSVRPSPEPRQLSIPSSPPPNNNNEPEADIELEALFANDRRYSLRTRQAKQIRPYAYDKLSYKQQLRGNPDAIVKVTSPRHHRRRSKSRSVEGGSDHNTQDDEWQLGDSASQWMDGPKGCVSPRASPHRSRYPGILPEMPDDDEDTRELDKEAKQLLKMRKARERLEKEEAKLRDRTKERRMKRFPVNMSVSDDEAVSALPGPSQLAQRVHNRPPPHARFPDATPSLALSNSPRRAHRSPSSVGSPVRSPTRSDYGADYLNDAALDFPMEVDDGIIRNSRDSPIIVGDDGPSQSADPGSPTQSDSESHHDEVQPRGKFRLLRRMMPEVLARKYETMGKPSTSKVSRRSKSFGDDDGDGDGDGGPILPGQSRRHITHGAREVIEIKGDTESSDDAQGLDDSSDQSSLSEAEEYRSIRAPTYHTAHDEHEVLSISSGDEDEAEVVGDEVIRACLDGSNRASFRKSDGKSESLIDWMLNRQRPAGRKPKRRRRKRARLEFATAGAKGKSLRQSTLFENFGPDEASSSSQPSASGFRPRDHAPTGKRKVRSSNSHGSSHTRVQTGRSMDTMSHDLKKQMKAKADRRKKRGLTYTFTEEGTRVTSGRRNSNIVTIDIEDEGFRQAIAHRWEPPKRGHPPQTHRIVKAHRRSTLPAPEYSDEDTQDPTHALTHKPAKSRRRRIEADFGLHPLPSGRSFNPQSHIGKGRLYELTNTLFDDAEPPPLPNYSSNGFDIGPDHSAEQFVDVFRRLCDSLLETVVGLPEDDAFDTWQGVMRVACQAISWYRARSNDDSLLLRNAVDTCVTKLADGINDAALSKKDLDSMTFAVCWFAIESLARAGPFPGHNATPSDTFLCASSLLVRHLLRYGLEETMKPVMDLDRELDEEHGLPCYTAELWVYLIYLAPLDPSGQPHFIWGLISDAIPKVTADMSNVDSSEAIWHAVFSICALSHFSAHGMAVSASRLPAYWELVSLALKQVKLITDLAVEQALSQSSLRKRDEYIGIMILRCHILVHRWNWNLDRASAVLTQIAEVFRSRKYADLAHERSGFPSFMVNNDWSLLDNDQHEDTAFVIFLKFLVRGSKLNLEDGTRKLTPMVKKLISLTVPVGRLPSDRDSFLSERERTMLRNRYCAAAVALYLEPANASLRISQARAYVNVKTVDHDTQIIIIRAAMYFGLLLMSLRLPLVDWWSWIEDIIKDLLLEYEAAQARLSDDAHLARDRLVVSIAVLVAAMNKIVEFFLTGTQEYPDPLALARLVPLTRGSLITEQDVIADRFRKLLLSFLEARDAVMPAPQRPTLAAIESQESQDEYGGFDLDVEDPEFLAAMGEGEHASQLREHQAKEKAASEIVHSHIGPAIYRHMCRFFSKLDGTRTAQKDYDGLCLWIDCWIGFANVVIQSRKVEGRGISWSSYLDRRADSWGRIKAIHLRRWVDMRVMLKLLETDPMEYAANKARCIAILFECFAASKVQGEDEYIAVLFSFEGSTHDLLRDVSLGTSETGDTTLSPLQFIESRDGIFASIVSSLNERLNREAAGEVDLHADNQQYIGCLISMFQAMEAELQALTDDQERHTYRVWCSAVGNSVERCSQIRAEPRLAYWLNWCRNLAT